jgi:hypothetical protein
MILVFHLDDRCARCACLDIVDRTIPVYDDDIQFACNRLCRFGHLGLPRGAWARAGQKECHHGGETQESIHTLFGHFKSLAHPAQMQLVPAAIPYGTWH